MQSGKSDEPEPIRIQPEEEKATEPLTEADVTRMETQGSTNAISRVLAVLILMCLPGLAGHYLDQWLGTRFLIGIGFILGMVLAIGGLLYVSNLADKSDKEARELRKRLKGSDKQTRL